MIASLGTHIPPPCPEEVELWLRSQEVSSNRLRMQGHGKSVGNNLAAMNEVKDTKENEVFEKFAGLDSPPDVIKSKGL